TYPLEWYTHTFYAMMASDYGDVVNDEGATIHLQGAGVYGVAALRLYEVTEQPRYMMLASYFIGQRGTQPHFYDEEYEKRGQTSY
ncbi:hypothetical protein MJN76_29210, partial [Salmonella enterica subsp. enterica serovar Anatum]|nr:hypothetical protein [Salmonella enterica subsp. enterica serovar Anatum]